MSRVKIFTNSAADLTPAQLEKLGVSMIPDILLFGETPYRNAVDIDPPTLYQKLAEETVLPTTSHPNIAAFQAYFRTAQDYDEIICINLTSKMSGAHSTACIARDMLVEEGFSPKLYLYDSLQVSYGLALLVQEAARLAGEGMDAPAILAGLDEMKEHIGVYFLLESLQNAKKGGRVGAIRVLAADLLGVKPVLMFRDGLVRDTGIVRGFDEGLSKVIDHYRTEARRGGEVFVFHADREKLAHQVAETILTIDPDATVHIGWVGAVIGIYTGTGCVGIAFREENA